MFTQFGLNGTTTRFYHQEVSVVPEGPPSPSKGLPEPSNQALKGQDAPNLDNFKLALTKEDFDSYDTDHSNNLSLKEIDEALRSIIDPQKQSALGALRADLAMRPRPGKETLESNPLLESWFGRKFAEKQLDRHDLSVIDTDTDDLLSAEELSEASKSEELSPMERHAASELFKELDASMNDPLLAVHGFRNWHKQRDATDAALETQKEFARKSPLPGVNLMVDSRDTTVLATDARGLPTEVITGAERYKLFYDSTGRLMEMQGRDGWKKTISYDDARGTQKISSFDENGNLESTEVRTIDQNQKRVSSQITDARGNRTLIDYDSQGREIRKMEINGDGRTEWRAEYGADGSRRSDATVYDATGKRRSETSRVSNAFGTRLWQTSYDEQGRPIEKVEMTEDRHRKGVFAQSSFDSRGNLLGTTEVKYEYNRVLELTDRNAEGEILRHEMPYAQDPGRLDFAPSEKQIAPKEMQTVPVRNSRSLDLEETLRSLNRSILSAVPGNGGILIPAE